MPRQTASKSIVSQLSGVQRDIRILHASDAAILKEIRDGFAHMETRFDQIYDHMDGFIKLHETLDIELRVMKEQMKRLEERVGDLEARARG
jgi:chaperonin cofactor prefoldin